MPRICVVVEIRGRPLLDFHGLNTLSLHFVDALQYVLHLDLMLQAKVRGGITQYSKTRTDGSAQPCPQFPLGPLITQ